MEMTLRLSNVTTPELSLLCANSSPLKGFKAAWRLQLLVAEGLAKGVGSSARVFEMKSFECMAIQIPLLPPGDRLWL